MEAIDDESEVVIRQCELMRLIGPIAADDGQLRGLQSKNEHLDLGSSSNSAVGRRFLCMRLNLPEV
jgi:hypothetical protein